MTTPSNWQAVHDQLTAEDRARLGEPPTGEEILAYMNGEMSEPEKTRIRALLVAYPELARTLAHPFPGLAEGETFSEEELSKHFADFQERLHPKAARVIPFRAFASVLAAAAAVVLVLGGLLWESRRELARPHLASEAQQLLPDGRRGPGGAVERVAGAGQRLELLISVSDQPELPAYRLELVDASEQRVWSSEAVQRTDSETFTVVLPRGLDAGRYAIVLYGVDGAREQRLTAYPFRVPDR